MIWGTGQGDAPVSIFQNTLSVTKLSSKDDLIREYLQKKIPQTIMVRLFNVSRLTLRSYIITRKLAPS